MIDMLDAGIHHLPVVDARGTPLGVVTATDLMYLESRTPFALRRSIAHAGSVDEVAAAARHLPQTIVALIKAGVQATDVGRVVALTGDTATIRLIDLAFAEHGPAPDAWAWMALGSTARREASLASDQDNALAYADGGDDDWFAAGGGGHQRRPGGLRVRRRQRRGAGPKPAVADVPGRLGAGVRGLPGAARPLAPDPGRGGLRLPARVGRPADRAAAGGDRAQGPRPSLLPAPAGPHRHRLQAAAGLSQDDPGGRRRRRLRRQEGRDRADLQPGPVPRPVGRRHHLLDARAAARRRGRGQPGAGAGGRAAGGVRAGHPAAPGAPGRSGRERPAGRQPAGPGRPAPAHPLAAAGSPALDRPRPAPAVPVCADRHLDSRSRCVAGNLESDCVA